MKILLLTPSDNFLNIKFADKMSFTDDIEKIRREIMTSDITRLNKEITEKDIEIIKPDILISFGYLPIIKKDVLKLMKNKAINLHLSYLPWNKGYDPIFWTIFDNTPCGVVIHRMDEKIDTGDIIARTIVNLTEDATLRSAYKTFRYELERLLYKSFYSIINGTALKIKQESEGSFHYAKDLKKYEFLLSEGINTPIKKIRDYGIKIRKNT